MPKEFDQETLDALKEQSGAPDEEPKKADGTPYGDADEPTDKPTETPADDEGNKGDDDDINLNLGDEDDKGEADKDTPGSEENKTVDAKLKEAGFDVEDIAKKIMENNGEIPDDIIKAAKEKLDPDLVDAHAARLKSEFKLSQIEASDKYKEFQEQAKRVQEMNNYIYDAVGGEDKFKSLASTLRDTLDKNTLESVNAKLLSGNKTLVNEALKTAVAEYKKAKGYGGKRMEGDANAPSEKELFITKEDYRTIMRTEKYKTDPQYRDKIDNARLKTRQRDQQRYLPGTYYANGPNGRYEI